jgi:signal peptidase I
MTSPNKHKGLTGIKPVLSLLVVALFVITFVVQAFQIPSGSMEKTLLIGDYVLVDKEHFARGGWWDRLMPYREIHRGDIVVFRYPVDPSQHFVKRVIGLPGDHIQLHNKTVFVNGAPLHETYATHAQQDFDYYRDNFPAEPDLASSMDARWRSELQRHVHHDELVVPQDEYFVLGDNRDQSWDSRYWGFVPRQAIVGQPLMVYLSVKPGPQTEVNGVSDKLLHSGHLLAHFWQFARWDRMFHIVR